MTNGRDEQHGSPGHFKTLSSTNQLQQPLVKAFNRTAPETKRDPEDARSKEEANSPGAVPTH